MLSSMRTTLNIDDDVLLAVKEISRQRHEPTGRLLSELVRTALVSKVEGRERNGVPIFPVRPGASIVTMELVNRLRDEAP
jgi:hypothetical protein